jgi:hypothetical protein
MPPKKKAAKVNKKNLDAATKIPKKTAVKTSALSKNQVLEKIAELADWRSTVLSYLRALIFEAVPDATEDLKWRGTPVWSKDGIICTGESYKTYVKLTFAKGASLSDPNKLFNASLEGNARRAIDIHEGELVSKAAFKAMVREAAALNSVAKGKR